MHCLFLSYIAGHVDLLGFFINTQYPSRDQQHLHWGMEKFDEKF
jgi:hypothetical protein